MRAADKQNIGQIGEKIAYQYLKRKGMRLVARNWRSKIGEIDLILRDREELVFVEVKTRQESRYAAQNIFENITYKKRRKLRRLVDLYLMLQYRRRPHPPVRIDVVGVLLRRNGSSPIEVRHIAAAV